MEPVGLSHLGKWEAESRAKDNTEICKPAQTKTDVVTEGEEGSCDEGIPDCRDRAREYRVGDESGGNETSEISRQSSISGISRNATHSMKNQANKVCMIL